MIRAAAFAGIVLLAAPAWAGVARHVLIVANNSAPEGDLPRLRFADDDGARWAELYTAAGARVQLLTTLDAESQVTFPGLVGRTRPPTRERLFAAIAHQFDDIRRDREAGMQTEFVLVYIGHGEVHGSQGAVLLADGSLQRDELFDRIIAASPAHFNLVMIDACQAYFMVMARGAWKDDRGGPAAADALTAYLKSPDALSRYPTTGVIVSTAGAAEVHEWEKLRSGVFSHELRSGLLGPADVDGDRRISFAEIEAFLAAANDGVTNPKARLQVFVHPPLQDLSHPLLDLTESAFTHFLLVPEHVSGHLQVEDTRGLAYAEWNKAPDHGATLALLYPPVDDNPKYFVRRGGLEATIKLPPPADKPVEIELALGAMAPARSAGRGSVDEAFRLQLFAVPYGKAFEQGFAASRNARRLVAEDSAVRSKRRGVHELEAAYRLSDALLPDDSIAHGFALAYRWRVWEHFHLGALFGWNRASGGQQGNAHTLDDMDLLLGGGAHFDLGDRISLWIDALVGNHWLLYRRTKKPTLPSADREDLFSPALGLSAGAHIRLVGSLLLSAEFGVQLVFSSIEGSAHEYWTPAGRLGLAYRF